LNSNIFIFSSTVMRLLICGVDVGAVDGAVDDAVDDAVDVGAASDVDVDGVVITDDEDGVIIRDDDVADDEVDADKEGEVSDSVELISIGSFEFILRN
jgi:hypothetical protein